MNDSSVRPDPPMASDTLSDGADVNAPPFHGPAQRHSLKLSTGELINAKNTCHSHSIQRVSNPAISGTIEPVEPVKEPLELAASAIGGYPFLETSDDTPFPIAQVWNSDENEPPPIAPPPAVLPATASHSRRHGIWCAIVVTCLVVISVLVALLVAANRRTESKRDMEPMTNSTDPTSFPFHSTNSSVSTPTSNASLTNETMTPTTGMPQNEASAPSASPVLDPATAPLAPPLVVNQTNTAPVVIPPGLTRVPSTASPRVHSTAAPVEIPWNLTTTAAPDSANETVPSRAPVTVVPAKPQPTRLTARPVVTTLTPVFKFDVFRPTKAASTLAPKVASTLAPMVPVVNGDREPTLEPTFEPAFWETEIPTVAPFAVPDLQDCYMDLTDLQAIIRAKDPFTKETFKLCPNTIFDIGYINASSYCCIDGQYPLHPRKDTTVQCGDDGSSVNNCIFRGGSTQIISYGPHHNYETKSNTAFKGITFESARDIGLLLMTDGEFLFDDCIFQNHTNLGSIKLAHYHSRRHLSRQVDSVGNLVENKYKSWADDSDRRLQDEEIDTPPNGVRLRATFNNCLFQHNGPGAASELTHYGVIYAETDYIDVIVNNSIFMDNAFIGSDVLGDSFAIHVVKDSSLEIHNSCFLSNEFVGRGAVLVDAAESIVAQSNNYGTNDPNVACQFINVGDASCIEFSSTTCLATRYQSLGAATSSRSRLRHL